MLCCLQSDSHTAFVEIRGSIFSKNTVSGKHPGFSSMAGAVGVYDKVYASFDTCRFTGNGGGFWGGAIVTHAVHLVNITNSEFEDNYSKYTGGAIYLVVR